MSHRLKRLYADFIRVSEAFRDNSSIRIKGVDGNPPETYVIEYRLKGLNQEGSHLVSPDTHVVEIKLPLRYPSEEPRCRMLTPVFHPNIDPNVICISDNWTAGESLVDLVVRIGEMIAYQSYNIKSPRNGEAARWAAENLGLFPIDPVDLTVARRPEDIMVTEEAIREVRAQLAADHQEKVGFEAACENCKKQVRARDLRECAGGHVVCEDCLVACGGCGRQLCVMCPLTKCSACGAILCRECQGRCSSCQAVFCHQHLGECHVCRQETCPQCLAPCALCGQPTCREHLRATGDGLQVCDACVVHCEGCGPQKVFRPEELLTCSRCRRPFCREHFDLARQLCWGCAPPDESRIKISYDELRPAAGARSPGKRFCPQCGHQATTSQARFCQHCGNRL